MCLAWWTWYIALPKSLPSHMDTMAVRSSALCESTAQVRIRLLTVHIWRTRRSKLWLQALGLLQVIGTALPLF